MPSAHESHPLQSLRSRFRRRHSQRGFTLMEMMVAGAIAAIASVAMGMVFLSQAQQSASHATRSSAQSRARQGLAFLELQLRNAGYGVDPNATFLAFDSYNAAADAPGVNYPDAIAIHTRDPMFVREITSATATTITVSTAVSPALLRKGQIVLALCPTAEVFTYATVESVTAAGVTPGVITLQPAVPAKDSPISAPRGWFRRQDLLTQTCFSSGKAELVRIERRAFYVAAFDDDNLPATPPVPYLMMHQGTDATGNGVIDADDATPVAAGIEQLQIAYIMNTVDATAPAVLGDDELVGWGEAWNTSVPGPPMKDAYDSVKRVNLNPANIRQIRVSVVARSSPQKDLPSDNLLMDGTTPLLENLQKPVGNAAFDPSAAQYARNVFRLSVAPKNLLMRSQFLPPARGGG